MNEIVQTKITTKMLRSMESHPKNNRQPCKVCGKHNSITVLHHLIPIEKVAKLINNGEISFTAQRKTVWLCPTCHAYVHYLYKKMKNDGSDIKPLLDKIKNESNLDIAFGVGNMVIDSFNEEIELKNNCSKQRR